MLIHKLIGWRTLVVVASLVLAEARLKADPDWKPYLRCENDGWTGWRPIPNQTGWASDREVIYAINSFGYRDREWKLPRPDDNVLRIALLGNSMTFGSGVPIEETWGRQLENRIREEHHKRGIQREVIVMNFSVQGFILEQMVRTYEHVVRDFEPDLVLVGTVSHDIVPFIPGTKDPDTPYRREIALTACYSHLLSKVMIPLRKKLSLKWGVDRAQERFQAEEDLVKKIPVGPGTEHLWEAARKRMSELEQQVHDDGARLVVLPLPRFLEMGIKERRTHRWIWRRWAKQEPKQGKDYRVLSVDTRDYFELAMADLWAAIRVKGMRQAYIPQEGSTRSILDPALPHREQCLFLERDPGHFSVKGHHLIGEVAFLRLLHEGYLD